jgi:PAS domain S-box-containing protein
VNEAIYLQNKDGIFLDVNDGAVKMYGYDKAELIGRTPLFVSAPDKNDIPKVAAMVEKAFAGEKQQFDFWGKRKNGEIFLKDVHLYPGKFFNEDVVIAVARDITKQREAETALKLSEERYKLIAENTIESITVFDLKLNYIYLSPSSKKLTGYSSEELTKLGLFSILSTDSIAKIQKIFKEEMALENSSLRDLKRSRIIETKLIRKDGELIWAESTLSFIRDKENNPVNILAVSRDITARKLVEQALADSEERYRIISSLTSDYLFSTSIDENETRKLVWVGGSFEKITGYTMDEYISVGGWISRLHHDDVETDSSDMKILKTNQKVISEVRTFHKNGNIIWVKSYAHPVWDNEKNKLKGIYGAVEDITQRKQAEILQRVQYNIADAVVTSKSITELFTLVRNELSSIINVNNFFIALYDEKSGLLTSDVNRDEVEELSEWKAKGSMTGYVIETEKTLLLNKNDILELIESGKAGMIGVIPEVWLGVPFKVAGKVIGVLVVQSYDNPKAYNKTSVEILEIVAHELSIFIQHKKSEEETIKLSTAIMQSPASIVITDPKGNIEYVNPKFSTISGYTLDEVKGKNPRFLKSGEHDLEFYKKMWETIINQKDWQGEIKNRKKNGELYWENVIISPITNDSNAITHFVAVKEDITDKKKMIEELIVAKEKAEEMNRVKSSFFSNMSHELRTPMVGILGFSEVLMNELNKNPDHLHMIRSINTSGRRLLETLNMILNLSKLEAAKVETNIQTMNIIQLLQESFNNFSSAVDKKGLKYLFKHDAETILCDVDSILFQSVFNNLINNAIKFTDNGSIQVIVKIHNNKVAIDVEDSGVGISTDKLNIIWDEFRQASEGYSRSFEGTGLGLTIAKRHVELMNGDISVKSLAGIGTTFTVTLPLSSSDNFVDGSIINSVSEPVISQTETKNKPKFLYVEDDEVSVLYVKTVTKDLYQIDVANDGDEAIACTKREKYDAILMDINLKKGIDGLELTKIIRRNPDFKNTPIIALTAFAMGHEKQEFLNKGMTHYLSKPFVKHQLLDILKSVIEK